MSGGHLVFGGATPTPDNYHHVQGMNTLMLEKQIRDWWFLSGGYYYSGWKAAIFSARPTAPILTVTRLRGAAAQITLRRESEIFSRGQPFLPLNYLSFSLGTQNEWTREEGFGDSVPDFEFGIPNTSASGDLG